MWQVVLYLGLCTAVLWGQGLSVVRRDGQNKRFLVAGERVRLVLAVTQKEQVYGAGCRLRYSPAAVLAVAGWRAGSFPSAMTIVVPGLDEQTGEGIVDVAALSPAQPSVQPVLAEVEFVLTPEAPHGSLVRFQVSQGWALLRDSIVGLPNSSVEFLVHGYVQVWPGDASDDGRVDVRDLALVGLYAHRAAMGYRRVPASTEWAPQQALAWEDPGATYADCDGNGVVSVRDLAVVLHNYDRRRGEPLCCAPLPVVEQGAEAVLRRWRLPDDAELVVGVFTPCTGESIRGLSLGGEVPVHGFVIGLDSVVVVAAYVRGTSVLRLMGVGALCGGQAEVRTAVGTWQPLEDILHAEAQQREDLHVWATERGWICLEGPRWQPGWLLVYSLIGTEVSRAHIPPGREQWCVPVPVVGPVMLLYRTEEGTRWARFTVAP